MARSLEDKKRQLEEEKEKLRLKERVIQEQEKRQRIKRLEDIGKLAHRAEIDQLGRDALLGAFMEMAERANDPKIVASWKKQAELHRQRNDPAMQQALVIKLEEEPTKEIKQRLRDLSFRWNSFRSEYYGYGSKDHLVEVLHGLRFSIEQVDKDGDD